MNEQEAFRLLTLASARDGRTVDKSVAKEWALDLADVDFDDAADAMRAHYQASDKWLMPSHVIDGVRAARLALQPQTMSERAVPCGPGGHRFLESGYCVRCGVRDDEVRP